MHHGHVFKAFEQTIFNLRTSVNGMEICSMHWVPGFFFQFMLMYWLFKASLMFASLHLVLIFIVNTVYILISLIKSTSLDCISLCCCCFHFRSFRALSYDAFIQLVFIVNITRIWISFVQIKLKLYRLLVVVVFVVVV